MISEAKQAKRNRKEQLERTKSENEALEQNIKEQINKAKEDIK